MRLYLFRYSIVARALKCREGRRGAAPNGGPIGLELRAASTVEAVTLWYQRMTCVLKFWSDENR
jgi:hypothetical protein